MDPVSAAAAGPFGMVLYGFWRLSPRKTVNFCVFGMQDSGKSTLHKSIEYGLRPVYQTRVPTTIKGVRYRRKMDIGFGKPPWFRSEDVPHQVSHIRPQVLDLRPQWIAWMVDVNKWQDEANWDVLKSISEVLHSTEYTGRTKHHFRVRYWSPWQGWVHRYLLGGKGVKVITMILNKVDTIPEEEREAVCREIVNHFTADASPMGAIKNDFVLHFIAGSVEQAWYLPHNDLGGRPLPLRKYMEELGKCLT